MDEYYLNLSDAEIDERITNLTPNQKEVYLKCLVLDADWRKALFVASSWPRE